MRVWLLFLPFYLFADLSWDEQTEHGSLRIEINQNIVQPHESLELKVTIIHPKNSSVNPLGFATNIIDSGHFLLLQEELRQNPLESSLQTELQYQLAPKQSGIYPLVFSPVEIVTEDGQRTVIYSPPFQIEVPPPENIPQGRVSPQGLVFIQGNEVLALSPENRQALIEDASKREDAKTKNAKLFRQRQFPTRTVFFLLALAAGIYLLVRAWKFQTRKPLETLKNPRERALSALRALKEKDLPGQGLVEPFFVQLSLILRFYIEDEHGIDAPEQTTEEFLERIRTTSPFSKEAMETLDAFLTKADAVKFARAGASKTDCGLAFQDAKNFVES